MNDRPLLQNLRALADVHAPPRVLEAVLRELGLGDQYASLDTALGPVFVAWNRLGVSAVMKTATTDEFEARFHELVAPVIEDREKRREMIESVRGLDKMRQVTWKF